MLVNRHNEISEGIIGAFYKVYNALGYGFSEKVYENALVWELGQQGLGVEAQKSLPVYYRDQLVGEYVADVVVDSVIIVELKAVTELGPVHEAQLLNYLKATPIEVGLLLNFGPRAEHRRRIYDNARKGALSWIEKGAPGA